MDLFAQRVRERLNEKKAEAARRCPIEAGANGGVESIAEVDGLPINVNKVLRDLRAEQQRRARVLKRKPVDTTTKAAGGSGGGDGGGSGATA